MAPYTVSIAGMLHASWYASERMTITGSWRRASHLEHMWNAWTGVCSSPVALSAALVGDGIGKEEEKEEGAPGRVCTAEPCDARAARTVLLPEPRGPMTASARSFGRATGARAEWRYAWVASRSWAGLEIGAAGWCPSCRREDTVQWWWLTSCLV